LANGIATGATGADEPEPPHAVSAVSKQVEENSQVRRPGEWCKDGFMYYLIKGIVLIASK
jgi:hypothetical protein